MSEQKQRVFHVNPSYKMVDTCAGEFNAETPYFYAGYDQENEAAQFLEEIHGQALTDPSTSPSTGLRNHSGTTLRRGSGTTCYQH